MSVRTLPLAALAAAVALFAAHGPAQPPKGDAKPADKVPKLADLLAKRVTLDKAFDGKFKDAVEMLADKFELPLVIDPSVREFMGQGMAACDGLEDKVVRLPKIANVRADTLLKLACEQADTMFLVYPDYIRIVPTVVGLYETGILRAENDPNEEQVQFLTPEQLAKSRPLTRRAVVNLSFKGATVADVLDEIAAASGATVTLAPLVGEKANAKLTVRFANAPVDAAVRTVCEMTDLAVIEDANVLVVTTPERAAARMKGEEDKKRMKLLNQIGLNPGLIGQVCGGPFFPGGGLGGLPPDASADVAKLKEQTEQMRKQLDEVLKLLKK